TSKASAGKQGEEELSKDIPFEKNNFKGKEKVFSSVRKDLENGMALFYSEPPVYDEALLFFLNAQEFNGSSADLNFKIGVCYMNSGTKYEALEYFEKAFVLNPAVDPDIHFYLGAANQIKNNFTKAKEEFEQCKKDAGKGGTMEMAVIDKRIAECNTGNDLIAHPVRVKIENLGAGVNTEYPEYSPQVTADESQIFFTSRRTDSNGGEKNEQGKYFEDIYMSAKGTDGKWLPAKNLGSPLNTVTHDAAAGLSADGHTLFVFKGDINNGDILISKLTVRGWSKAESAGKNINTSYHESSASLSPDGNTLYFVSDRSGGSGKRDIYYSRWVEKKKAWGEAVNIGAPVNSAYDEEGVWMHPDGKTLYFSSKGEGTMGGYDIFYSKSENGKWSAPVNLGSPVNSADDDVFIEMAASGKRLYFASVKKEGIGEKDIYSATYLEEAKIKSKVALYKGHVFDADTKLPVAASIELVDLEKNEGIGKFNSDPASGKYLVSLPGGKNYGAVIKADGYLFSSDNFNIPDTADYNEYNKDIFLQPIKAGSVIVLKNIFFDTAKWNLKDQSVNELERLLEIMNSNPKLKIEISGHTDNVGKDEANQVLSENRSKAVVDYLKSKNVSETRLQFHGYGETMPVATNETVEGRVSNRRTEFKILAN
ncbi:MAG: OmpA family protein, partial [Bacteroidota bacterium]